MDYLDIHSHILPNVDDGAKDIETSLALLEALKTQGVTAVIATPHFYPDYDNAEEFVEKIDLAYKELKNAAAGQDLPRIFLGCELRYFNGMGKSKSIDQFAIKGTDHLLLELPYGAPITKLVLDDIIALSENLGFKVILAHIERYYKVKGFKKLLKLISDGYAIAHINADGMTSKEEAKICEKLIKGGYISFVASDTHSVKNRPPKIKEALDAITDRLGKSTATRLMLKSNRFLEELETAYEKL
ncbi:MAG: hypothetical protein Q4B40_02115 [Clostridia bacterium]|nr:hypothetical protein [Clostridia bacterium]